MSTLVPFNPWNLTQINAGGGRTDGPLTVSDPFVSLFGDQQHFGYRDSTGMIHDSWYDGSTGKFNLQQINGGGPDGKTVGPAAVGGPFIFTVGGNDQQHFLYRDVNGTIFDSWFDNTKARFNLQRINTTEAEFPGLTQGPAAVSDPSGSVFNNQQHFGYRDSAGIIYDAFYDGQFHLQQINGGGIGGKTKGPAAAGGPFIWTDGNQLHFTYRDQSGTIFDSWFDNTKDLWNLQQINTTAAAFPGLTQGPPAIGDPFVSVFGSQQHFFYRSVETATVTVPRPDPEGIAFQENHISDSWFDGTKDQFNYQQIDGPVRPGVTDGPSPAGDPFAFVFDPGSGQPGQHIGYRNAAGVIHDAWFSSLTSTWSLQQINNPDPPGLTAGPAAAGGPFIWALDWRQQHFTYRDQRGVIYDSWLNNDIS